MKLFGLSIFNGSIDIGSKNHPELSNFNNYQFKFYKEEIASMEGLLQGIKFKDIEKQREVFKLSGYEAKKAGKKSNWKETQSLYFLGTELKRDSEEYQNFLKEAFHMLFTNNMLALKALVSTGNKRLKHSIGKSNPKDTVLTEKEFCNLLTEIRKKMLMNI